MALSMAKGISNTNNTLQLVHASCAIHNRSHNGRPKPLNFFRCCQGRSSSMEQPFKMHWMPTLLWLPISKFSTTSQTNSTWSCRIPRFIILTKPDPAVLEVRNKGKNCVDHHGGFLQTESEFQWNETVARTAHPNIKIEAKQWMVGGKSLKCSLLGTYNHLGKQAITRKQQAMWLTCLQGRNSAIGMVHGTWHIISITVLRTDIGKPCGMPIAMCCLLTVLLWSLYHREIKLLVTSVWMCWICRANTCDQCLNVLHI